MRSWTRWIAGTVLVAVAVGGVVLAGNQIVQAQTRPTLDGPWYVQAVDAPYEPHQFIFHEGIVWTTNPTNVQDGPDAAHPVTDSVGMGSYRYEGTRRGVSYYVGTFYQENALQPDRVRGPQLAVTFRIGVKKDSFSGPAVVFVGGNREPDATLVGTRLKIDERAVRLLGR